MLSARGDIQKHDLVGALALVARGELDGVAHVAQAHEVDALHDAPGPHVEARDDPAAEGVGRVGHRARSFPSAACPQAPLFSGWNCTATVCLWRTALTNVSPYVVVAMAASDARTANELTK